ncbi:MAG: multifunctional CCA addition/repair protein [Gammaproteobacteria bacterium]|nr:multifunctional CCA addition/repair protein [Gammaproteobacteria bacterium]MDE2024593.1 multifunctional CCA addition/repair protein [Gammaproteobacteria bacterium]MDE2139354.1 multifunctional CCA addition/repair protein [Gammaproteobacteria bacterium]MDE2274080.1 multifunctional CCA addition/repair protein [Gammaproteobacteria bacterium]
MQIYLVGGAVRDRLLGLPVQERDWVVVGATPDEMLALGYRPVGKDFPVFLHPETHEEYALARTERKTGRGYHGFEFHSAPQVTLEDDLKRRDLTINALAEDAQGKLIDPYGGARDLDARVLRHVSPAFAEDPVRVLRVARFAARFALLGFRLAPETLALMRAMAGNGEVDALIAERVWQETVKALATERPSVFFQTLRECDALARVFPELDRLFGVPQPAEHHPEIDTGVHVMLVLDQAARLSPDPALRFAALVHDLGKGTTPADKLPHHYGHEERGAELVDALCERLRVPREFRELALLAARFHGKVHRAAELRPETALRLLQDSDAFRRPQRFEQLLLACEADARGRSGLEARPYPQAELLRRARAAAAAVSIPGGTSGAEIGKRLNQARLLAVRKALGRKPA